MKIKEIQEELAPCGEEYDLRIGETTRFDFNIQHDDKIVIMIPLD